MSDEQDLLLRAKRFDPSALSMTYELFSPIIYRYAYHLLGDPNLAEECLADTYKRFLQSIKNGSGPKTNLKAYLYRIAHNWIIDRYRDSVDNDLELSEEFSDGKSDPKSEVHQKLEQETIRKAVMRLTAEQRQVIVLKYIEEYENDEIAQILNKNIGSIKALQHRALASLRKLLAEDVR
ncbi:MAG: RNA polymerase sigma factor [Anaerolineaceae bacterium]